MSQDQSETGVIEYFKITDGAHDVSSFCPKSLEMTEEIYSKKRGKGRGECGDEEEQWG